MNNKFLPGAVLFIVAFVLSNLASLAQVKAQNTFYGEGAGQNITTGGLIQGLAPRRSSATPRQREHGHR